MADEKDQNAWNNNPQDQPRDMGSVQASNPTAAPHGNPAAVAHQALEAPDDKKESGVDIGLVSSPTISLNPTSAASTTEDEKPEFTAVSNVSLAKGKDDFQYPFNDTEIGDGFFIPLGKGETTDQLIAKMHSQIDAFRLIGAEVEKDKDGNEIWEMLITQIRKRTDDGAIQLDGMGKPIVLANQTNRPLMVYSTNFAVHPIVKDDEMADGVKAESDGVLVVRVY